MRSCVSRKDRSSSSTSSSNAAMPQRVERSATEREQAAVARRVGGEDDRAPAGAANRQTDAAAQWPPAELESTPLLAAVEHRAQPQPRGRVVVRAPAQAAAGGRWRGSWGQRYPGGPGPAEASAGHGSRRGRLRRGERDTRAPNGARATRRTPGARAAGTPSGASRPREASPLPA